MFRKTIIFFFLGAFLFQTLLFNACLYTLTLLVKYEEKSGHMEWIEFSEQQFEKIKLNESEFLYLDNLYDVFEIKKEAGTVRLLCKIDAKEKDFLEKLIEGFKQSKNKKCMALSFLGDFIKSGKLLLGKNNHSVIKRTYFISSLLEKSLEQTIPPPKA